jgi:hypothetical protein
MDKQSKEELLDRVGGVVEPTPREYRCEWPDCMRIAHEWPGRGAPHIYCEFHSNSTVKLVDSRRDSNS